MQTSCCCAEIPIGSCFSKLLQFKSFKMMTLFYNLRFMCSNKVFKIIKLVKASSATEIMPDSADPLPSLLLSPGVSRSGGSRSRSAGRPNSKLRWRDEEQFPQQQQQQQQKQPYQEQSTSSTPTSTKTKTQNFVSQKFAEETEELLSDYFGRVSGGPSNKQFFSNFEQDITSPVKKLTAAQRQKQRHKEGLELHSPSPASITQNEQKQKQIQKQKKSVENEWQHPNHDSDEDDVESSDFLNSCHFVSHMLHRTTNVSGEIPIGEEASREQSVNLAQIELLKGNAEMNGVIEGLRDLSLQFKHIVRSVSSHRKELALSIKQTHTTYVRLFERMLFVVLKLQRKKEKSLEDDMGNLKSQISSLVLQNDLLQAQLIKLGDQTSALVGLNQSLHTERNALTDQVGDLQVSHN